MIARLRSAISGSTLTETDREAAERFNREMAKREAKNFYWGFISLPHEQRMAIYALYNYGRILDDEADDSTSSDLPARLQPYRERVKKPSPASTETTIRSCRSSARLHSATRFPNASLRC